MKAETRTFLRNYNIQLVHENMDWLGEMLEEYLEYAATHQEGGECYVECEQETELHLVESYPNQQTGRLVSYLQKKLLPQISEGEMQKMWEKEIDPETSSNECFFHYTDDLIFKAGIKAAITQLMKGTTNESNSQSEPNTVTEEEIDKLIGRMLNAFVAYWDYTQHNESEPYPTREETLYNRYEELKAELVAKWAFQQTQTVGGEG